MKKILITLSFLGLALTLVPSLLVLKGILELKDHYLLMTVGMVLWFATAPFWMKSKSPDRQNDGKESPKN
ncbi:MAG: hypothetical protein WBK43_03020 [Prolixibacteraceae bacterium]|jgi:hypothetical protein|nr:hypothetical protein [Prolixibacteraceae bacterium]MDI9565068.1 hypothetical protein [Bacteroidota bacterium]NLT00512.1 hypothetical protein [Bacteroidales bacterium]OQB80977.1 MAG: hypothetical protein BWX87_00990 [Bacteroidetes bacterium ADurb.Bin123]HNU76944.1 hypothetical protein [Prolixibacteraceae bacterium]